MFSFLAEANLKKASKNHFIETTDPPYVSATADGDGGVVGVVVW